MLLVRAQPQAGTLAGWQAAGAALAWWSVRPPARPEPTHAPPDVQHAPAAVVACQAGAVHLEGQVEHQGAAAGGRAGAQECAGGRAGGCAGVRRGWSRLRDSGGWTVCACWARSRARSCSPEIEATHVTAKSKSWTSLFLNSPGVCTLQGWESEQAAQGWGGRRRPAASRVPPVHLSLAQLDSVQAGGGGPVPEGHSPVPVGAPDLADALNQVGVEVEAHACEARQRQGLGGA